MSMYLGDSGGIIGLEAVVVAIHRTGSRGAKDLCRICR